MSDVIWLAVIAQVGTLLTLIVTAVVGRRKLDHVKDLVNGHSEKQAERIAALQALLQREQEK